jgi:hypothetical protein
MNYEFFACIIMAVSTVLTEFLRYYCLSCLVLSLYVFVSVFVHAYFVIGLWAVD